MRRQMKAFVIVLGVALVPLMGWAQGIPFGAPATSGAAGGDLSGTYPNPTVAKIGGTAVGTPSGTAGTAVVLGTGATLVNPSIQDSGGAAQTMTTTGPSLLRSVNGNALYLIQNNNTGTAARTGVQFLNSTTPGTATLANTSSGFTTAGGIAANTLYLQSGSNGTGGILLQSQSASGGLIVQTGGTTVGMTIDNTQQVTLPGVTTGTNADFVCMAAGNKLTLQSSACTISSMRFKRDIVPVTESALVKIERLVPVAFNMREDTPNPDANFGRRQLGLTAENVAATDPRLAIYEDDGTTPKSYRQEAVIALAIKAIKEQQAEIDDLKTRLPSNDSLWSRIRRKAGF